MLVALLATAALAAGDADLLARQAAIAERIDLTSFPNSTGPRRRPGAKTPAQYGFTQVGARDGWTVLSDGSWEMAVRLLSGASGHVVVCFADTAVNGGTYNTQKPLDLKREHDGLFRVVEASGRSAACPIYPKDR